ncbi:MAG: FeoA family protein [Eubacterium sp.]
MFLSDMKEGQTGVISAVNFDNSFKTRLNDMGFCDGESVICIKRSVMSSPILYRVKGAGVALRKSDAKHIEVVL